MRLSVKVHPAGWIFLALMMAILPAAMLLAVLLALLIHEGGHLLCMLISGLRACSMELTPFGGIADVPEYENLSQVKKILCALAGPLANLACVGICLLIERHGSFWWFFLSASVTMACLNLLPVFPLDGARVLAALFEKTGFGHFVSRITLALAYLFALFLFLLGIAGALQGKVNISLFLLPPYLCYTAYQSALYTRIRSVRKTLFPPEQPLGEIRSAGVYAVNGQPEKLALMRYVQGVKPNHPAILYIYDECTGNLKEILTLKQIRHKLISE